MPFEPTLGGFDREIARADASYARWLARLRDGEDRAASEDALLSFRHVAGKTAYAQVMELPATNQDDPWKGAVLRWIIELTQRRIGRDAVARRAVAAREPRGRLPIPPFATTNYEDAWRGALSENDLPKIDAYLVAAALVGPRLAEAEREHAERRTEVGRRYGLSHPLAPWGAFDFAHARRSAVALLDATEDLWRQVTKGDLGNRKGASAAVGILAARVTDAPEGWPARLTKRWLEELVGAFAQGLAIEPRVPAALGASSFARALASFGYELRAKGPSPALPFALRMDPFPIDAHRFAFVFGALPGSVAFQQRCLQNVRRVAQEQARRLGIASLREARAIAARVLLVDEAGRKVDFFSEITARLFGAPLPADLAGAWPHASGNELRRLAALLTTLPLETELVARFDVDWFANPRSVAFLRSRASAPALAPEDAELPADTTVQALAKYFEEELG